MQLLTRLLTVILVLIIFVTLGELVLSLFARGIMPH